MCCEVASCSAADTPRFPRRSSLHTCLYGVSSLVEAFALSVATQRTIGFGNSGPQRCWTAAWTIVVGAVLETLLSAAALGLGCAAVAPPKHRGTSIKISDSAVVSRRDGILK